MVKHRTLAQAAYQATFAIELVDALPERRRPSADVPHTLPAQLKQKGIVVGGSEGGRALSSCQRCELAKNLGCLKGERRRKPQHVADLDLAQPARHA